MNHQRPSIKIYLYTVITGLLVLLILCSLQVQAASVRVISQSNPNFKLELLAQDLGVPWGMAFLNDRELIFTERLGNIRILNLESLEITT